MTFNELAFERDDVLDVDCPTCGAVPGDECTKIRGAGKGVDITAPHSKRHLASVQYEAKLAAALNTVPDEPCKPRERQPGGDHYINCGIQPIDFINANDLLFAEGNVVKLVTRHRDKGGRLDIEKAIHYLEFIIERDYPNEFV